MATKKQQTEMQQVINILKPHMCSCGLKTLNSYAKLSIKEAWNKCTSPQDLLSFKLMSVYTKNKKSKTEFAKVIKATFKAIDVKLKADIKALPQWIHDAAWIAPDISLIEEDVLGALGSDDLDDCFDLPDELEDLDVHAIIKKHLKTPTLQDFLDIKLPDAEQKAAINDWYKLTEEQRFKLLVQYKLYDSSGKRLFK
jgi:hypothetical protein